MFIVPMAPVQLPDRFRIDHEVPVRSEVRIAMSELLLAVLSEALGAALVALLIAAVRRVRGAVT
jgi:hypothetical protein